ncbi:MAG TPA: hypothetical protein DDZ60_10375 [Planktothrix sp. UBA10369]|nr:hypothetical protein [Planktothrix sp. UBA10369]
MTSSMTTEETKLAPGEYKVITLWQPYATLIATGIKHYETRSWPTNYRGTLLIHAAKRPMKVEQMATLDRLKNNPLITRAKISQNLDDYPLGVILCKSELTDCIPAKHPPNIIEKAVGDWHPIYWAWRLTDITPITPIPIGGKQGFWDYCHSENPHSAEFDL